MYRKLEIFIPIIALFLLFTQNKIEAQDKVKSSFSFKKGKVVTVDRLVYTDEFTGLELYLRTIEKRLTGKMIFSFFTKGDVCIQFRNIYTNNHKNAELIGRNGRSFCGNARSFSISIKNRKASHFVFEKLTIMDKYLKNKKSKNIGKMLFILTDDRNELPHYLRVIDKSTVAIDISKFLN